MTDPYLIAHKVRGESAFDVAIRMECPHCSELANQYECHECDFMGFWWIIPTSGHRAFPYWDTLLADIDDTYELSLNGEPTTLNHPGPMPEGLPDHYRTLAEPRVDLAKALGLKPKPLPPIVRRL
jgi:hypothetical protein